VEERGVGEFGDFVGGIGVESWIFGWTRDELVMKEFDSDILWI